MPELEGMLKRQQVLAAFGEFAINSDDLDAVLMEACRLVGEATGTGRAKVLEIQESRQELLVRAGVGWAPDVVGTVRLQMGERSSETYAIKAATPVVTQDIAKDDRFDVPHFMKQAGVVALVNVPIFVPGQRPYGVLQIDDTRPREFGDDEIEFLRTYAMILGPVIDRLHLVKERARDRERMRAGEARHSLLIGSWAQAEWETDADGIVIADSPSWRAYTGQTVKEWLGYGWLDAIHPHDRGHAEKQWREAIAAHRLVNAEFRLHAPDGSWRWTNVRAAPVLDTEGSLVKWVGMNIDIDARMRAEAALGKSEAQFRALATVGSSSVYRMSPDWSEMHNLEGAAFLADTEVATVGWIDRYIPPDERPLVREAINRAIAAKDVFELEHRVLLADGTVGWTFSRAIPLLDDAGEISEWFGAATDITARVKADQSFTRLFQASPVPFLVLKPDAPHFTISEVNDAYLSATMRTRGEVVGRGIFEAYPDNPDELATGGVSTLRASLEHVLASRQPDTLPNLQYDVMRPDGTYERRFWNPVNSAILDDNGEVEAIIHNANDVTEARLAEVALRDSQERFLRFSDASTDVLWIRNAATLRMEFASPAFDRIYGIPGPERGGDDSLRSWARLIEPENRKSVLANFQRVRAGERVDHEFQVKRASDGALRWIHNTDFPLRDGAGDVRWVAGLGADITDEKETADRQGVLVAELQHRTRNLIAVVRSLSDRTLGNAASLEDFGQRFRMRLAALSRVQGLLSHVAIGERVTFKELLCSELDAHGASNGMAHKVTLDGPVDVPLRSATVQTFALALHELATNAAKYGALEAPNGHLFVSWHVEPAAGSDPPRLHVEWRETGVSMPGVAAPARGGGYGRELIERALPYQLKAKTTYEMGSDGVRCTIAVPIAGGINGGASSRE